MVLQKSVISRGSTTYYTFERFFCIVSLHMFFHVYFVYLFGANDKLLKTFSLFLCCVTFDVDP